MVAQVPPENWRYQLRRGITDLWFMLSIFLAIFVLVILCSYQKTDPGWSTSGSGEVIKNWFGAFGAYISDALFSLFGYAAYFISLGFLMIGWHSTRRPYIDPELVMWKIFALGVSLLSLAGIFSLHWEVHINSLAITAGGLIGQKLSIELLRIFSIPLVMLTFTFFFLLGITLLLEMSWLKLLEKIGVFVTRGWEKATPERNEGIADKIRLPVRNTKEASIRRLTLTQRMSTDIADQRAAILPTELDPLLRGQPNFELSSSDNPTPSSNFINPEEMPPPIPTAATVIRTPVSSADTPPPIPEHARQPRPQMVTDNLVSEKEATPPSTVLSWRKYQEKYDAQVFQEELDTTSSTSVTPEKTPTQSVIFDMPEVTHTEENLSPPRQEGLRVHLNAQGQSSPPVSHYPLPSLDLLNAGEKPIPDYSAEELDEMAMRLENALKNYKLSVQVENITVGPVVTRFELSLAPGVKVSSINNLEKDIARSLAVPSIRVVDIIPGKPFIGLEMPNRKRQIVPLRSVLADPCFLQESSPLTMALGVDVKGEPVITDLRKMPHLLVAGTTGSGKSVGVNVMLASMLFKSRPDDLKLILIDPKMLEMTMYSEIPHLLTPVITDMLGAENALCWAVAEMERRYQLLAAMKVRKIDEFNKMVTAAKSRGEEVLNPFYRSGTNTPLHLSKLPYIVIVVDEMADLMMVAGKNVEQLIARIAQKARAAGIHLILATQRPSVDVITGLIKANIPSRIAFQVSAKIDSRIILDTQGAENLLGYGDMFYAPAGVIDPIRVHGAFIDDQEVDRLTNYLRSQGRPHYEESITTPVDVTAMGALGAAGIIEPNHD